MRSKRTATTEADPSGDAAEITVWSDRPAGRPILDTAISHALLRRVAAGEQPETLRLYVPDEAVVFSLLDARRPGFAAARLEAHRLGAASVLRLAGGHAALFHPRCLAFAWAMPDRGEPEGIRRRFEVAAAWLRDALERLGVDARIGSVPQEYCPGEFSVNARGRVKLVGLGQRVIRGAAHVGGVIVVGGAGRVREVLGPVYAALGLDFDPAAAGALDDESPGVDVAAAERAILEALAARRPWRAGAVDPETLRRAGALLDWHDPDRSPRAAAAGGGASKSLVVRD